jgi:hypothetical protein
MKTKFYLLILPVIAFSFCVSFSTPHSKGPAQKPLCEAVNYLLTHFEKRNLKKIYDEKTADKKEFSVIFQPVVIIEGFVEQEVILSQELKTLSFEAYYDYDDSNATIEGRNIIFKELVQKIESCTGKKGEFSQTAEKLTYELKINDVTLVLASNKTKIISIAVIIS